MATKDNSLIEIAIDLLRKKQTPQSIHVIIKEVMSLKGIKSANIVDYAPQFVMDFMTSGYFIYCGNDCWDLKDRQPTSVLDKDGGYLEEKNDELKQYEQWREVYGANYPDDTNYDSPDTSDEYEEDEEETEDDDDLSGEFEEVLVESVEEEDEED